MHRTQTQTVGQTTPLASIPATQQLTMCTICPHTGTACQVGHAMMAHLQKAIASAGDSIEQGFEISGYAEMGGCGRKCLLAYHGTRSSTHLFGDVVEGEDIGALLDYATEHHTALNCGKTPAAATPLTRAPGAVMAMRSGHAHS